MDYKERKAIAHANGRIVAYGGTYSIPSEYKRFIGVLSDEAIHAVTRKRKGMLSPETLDRIIKAAGGSKNVTSWLIRFVAQRGIGNVLGKSTDDFVGLYNVGRAKLDALVALGVEDRRIKREPFTQRIGGRFEGTLDGKPIKGKIRGLYTSDRSMDNRV